MSFSFPSPYQGVAQTPPGLSHTHSPAAKGLSTALAYFCPRTQNPYAGRSSCQRSPPLSQVTPEPSTLTPCPPASPRPQRPPRRCPSSKGPLTVGTPRPLPPGMQSWLLHCHATHLLMFPAPWGSAGSGLSLSAQALGGFRSRIQSTQCSSPKTRTVPKPQNTLQPQCLMTLTARAGLTSTP